MISAHPGVIGGRETPVVDGRELHSILAYGCDFEAWFLRQAKHWDLTEGVDFETFFDEVGFGGTFSLRAAEKICSLCSAEYIEHGLRNAAYDRVIYACEKATRDLEKVLGVVKAAQNPPAPPVESEACEKPPEPAVQPVPQPVKAKKKMPTARAAPKPKVSKVAKVATPFAAIVSPRSGRKVDARQLELF
jgi:hypothetical protein